MDNKFKDRKLPRSALELYLRFYWKTKKIQCEESISIFGLSSTCGSERLANFIELISSKLIENHQNWYTSNTLQRKFVLDHRELLYTRIGPDIQTGKSFEEATKTWFSLTSYEKMKFINKYKDLQNTYKKNVALNLKTAKPYMKKKLNVSELVMENDHNNETDLETHIRAPIEDNLRENEAQTNIFLEADVTNPNENISSIDTEEPVTTPADNHLAIIVSEPEPPAIKSGRQLYDLIRARNSTYCLWNQLSAQEKKRYQAAALTLKKEYINKLKLYLENLPSHELFKAYHKYC